MTRVGGSGWVRTTAKNKAVREDMSQDKDSRSRKKKVVRVDGLAPPQKEAIGRMSQDHRKNVGRCSQFFYTGIPSATEKR